MTTYQRTLASRDSGFGRSEVWPALRGSLSRQPDRPRAVAEAASRHGQVDWPLRRPPAPPIPGLGLERRSVLVVLAAYALARLIVLATSLIFAAVRDDVAPVNVFRFWDGGW
jgi:hypothetical protein